MKGNLPAWFTQKPPESQIMQRMEELLNGLKLHTICNSARCPNIGKCFSQGTATFLILGDVCTRNCNFCAVTKGHPDPPDEKEPQNLFEAVERLDLSYVVITSVTRDDLPDGGAKQFARAINLLHQSQRPIGVEVLIPDFQGESEALKVVIDARPEVLNHNIETVPGLYPEVRPLADYCRSVELLAKVKTMNPEIITKSGMMLGLGESKKEVVEVMSDLREAGCDLLTIGQYLQPSPAHHAILRFVPPGEFTDYERIGVEMGFSAVASSPLVRSSFEAANMYARLKLGGQRA